MEESKLLAEIVETENNLHLDRFTIFGVPLWRIVRYHTRVEYINKKVGYITGSPTVIVGKKQLKFCSGFWTFIGKRKLNIFFPFNRLSNIGGQYIDKFTDPVIDESQLIDDVFMIVEAQNYVGAYKRIHKQQTVSNEGRTILSQLIKKCCEIIVPVKYRTTINEMFNFVKDPFMLEDTYIKRFYFEVAHFIARYQYYKFWFKVLRPKRVFIVYREGYFPIIAACKKLNIPVAEFQHGITLDNTVSYAGDYDARIDPDYFLTFGEFWKGPQFGMPLDRIVNIGWAYSKYLSHKVSDKGERHANEVLVISSPEISDAILDTLATLSDAQGDFSFHIRLHPCESYSDAQKEKLSKISKAIVVDNKIDSAIVLPTYKYVVGENSSVIYEALSVGCKVGMLNMCGLRPAVDLPGIQDSFFIISSISDFESFMQGDCSMEHKGKGFYSEFDNKRFMDFVNTSM